MPLGGASYIGVAGHQGNAVHTDRKYYGFQSQPGTGKSRLTARNYVSWEDREPVYDIRTWNIDHSQYGQGVTLTPGQMAALKDMLNGIAVF